MAMIEQSLRDFFLKMTLSIKPKITKVFGQIKKKLKFVRAPWPILLDQISTDSSSMLHEPRYIDLKTALLECKIVTYTFYCLKTKNG
jgi:hypothetical protein